MKFLIVSNVLCNIDYFMQQVRNNNVDAVLSVGNFGIMYGGKKDTYVYSEPPRTIGQKKRELKLNGGMFKRIVEGHIVLPKRTFAVANTGDNGVLASKIRAENIRVKNFSVLTSGKVQRYGGLNIMSLGGHYNNVVSEYNKMRNCYFDSDDVSYAYATKIDKIHILLLNDVFGGKEKDGSFDLTKTVTTNEGVELDLMGLADHFDIDIIFLGDCKSGVDVRNDIISWNFGKGDRTLVSCQDMKIHSYIYDTEKKTISYV